MARNALPFVNRCSSYNSSPWLPRNPTVKVESTDVGLIPVFNTSTFPSSWIAAAPSEHSPSLGYSTTIPKDTLKRSRDCSRGHSQPPLKRAHYSRSGFKQSLVQPSGFSSTQQFIMAHPYGTWSPEELRNAQIPQQPGYPGGHHSGDPSRGSGSGAQQSYVYPEAYPTQYGPGSARHSPVHTAPSSSSLSGAVGDLGMSTSSPPNGMSWTPSPPIGASDYLLVHGQHNVPGYLPSPTTPLQSESPPTGYLPYTGYNSAYPNSLTDSPPLGIPSPDDFSGRFAYQQSRHLAVQSVIPSIPATAMDISMDMSSRTPAPVNVPISRSARSSMERQDDEVKRLRNKIKELELINRSAVDRVKQLEQEVARIGYAGVPSGLPTPATPLSSRPFDEGWRIRTDARKKLLCSLNRAGNAMCAWHDSRRERRVYPPRAAPLGTLNCGCTEEEALFEESLARHGVGSYHPGESVRMDPSLRNPLLRLLQERYGYRDGDFERDSVSGNWIDGEGPALWQSKVVSGSKKNRGDN